MRQPAFSPPQTSQVTLTISLEGCPHQTPAEIQEWVEAEMLRKANHEYRLTRKAKVSKVEEIR